MRFIIWYRSCVNDQERFLKLYRRPEIFISSSLELFMSKDLALRPRRWAKTLSAQELPPSERHDIERSASISVFMIVMNACYLHLLRVPLVFHGKIK